MYVCPVWAAVEMWQNDIRETIVQKVKVWSRWCHSSPVKAKPRLFPLEVREFIYVQVLNGGEHVCPSLRLKLICLSGQMYVGNSSSHRCSSEWLTCAPAIKGERICVWAWKKERLHKYLNVYVCVCVGLVVFLKSISSLALLLPFLLLSCVAQAVCGCPFSYSMEGPDSLTLA